MTAAATLDDAAGDFPGGWGAYRRHFPDANPDDYVAEYGRQVRPRLTAVRNRPATAPTSYIPEQGTRRDVPWDAHPHPLTPSVGPPFPLHTLPERIRLFVSSVAAALQVPPDLVASLALSAIATAVAGKAEVQPKPGWTEPLNLWVINVLPPAARKSATMSAIIRPLHEMQVELQETARGAISEAKAAKKIAEKRADSAENAAVKATGNDARDAEAEAADARAHADALVVPAPPRLLASDITPEQVGVMLHEQGGRLGIFSPEGGLFGTMAGRYSGATNLDVFLQGHAGDPVTVDRVGRDPLHVARPALSLGLAVQPDVVREVGSKPAMRDRGLTGRFLWVVPPSGVGSRTQDSPSISQVDATRWALTLRAFLELPVPDKVPLLTMDEAGYAAFKAFGEQLEPRLSPDGGDLAGVGDWAGKLHGHVARIAALLHLVEHGAAGLREPLSAATVTAAGEIGRWAIPHALAAYALLGAHRDMSDAQRLLRWLRRQERPLVTVRDAQQSLKPAFTAESVRAAFDVLEEHGWVRRVPDERSGSGPRSEWYETHPEVRRVR
jgi:replicative DNA helicase